ncbi:hypothetical protein PP753_gp71 [Dinoroseobacter phage vB_DshP-R7L]|uniref:Uncharacterized protein n=1 Tax=Dinoroseobacter phage vB_DshP-R7L TaxID=2873349 RepID=A0AAE8XD42_9CAUD|nr:hypothetical protein PP753_gp71 [Dinoroseobacter phage vB_DshP-R7L]UAT28887.1 hypothetical protein R7L_gp48 [Dinoroseobacter phage vB_DshP-R7L]
MEMIQAILATGVILVGMMTLGLVMQVIHQVRIQNILTRVETLESRILARLLMEENPLREYPGSKPVTLEDLIRLDLMEQMGQHSPMTDKQVQEIVKEMHDDPNLIPPTNEDLRAVLETRKKQV